MMNDTVREDLESKVTTGKTVAAASKQATATPQAATAAQPALAKKRVTAGLVTSRTSPTLVGFPKKNPQVPDWRMQLHNAVQQRKGPQMEAPLAEVATTAMRPLASLETQAPAEIAAAKVSDPRVANAMRRIAESRSNFLESPMSEKKSSAIRNTPMLPFGVVSSNRGTGAAVAAAPAPIRMPPKPVLVSAPRPVEKRDTNKLPPIEMRADGNHGVEEPIAHVEKIESGKLASPFVESKRIHITSEAAETEELDHPQIDTDEIEDLAPFSMRFAAGLFDVIIGGFAAMVALSPLAFSSSDWFTASSVLTFAGTWAILMFFYLTACLGFFGKTMGMRLFQLELVDAIENEYPTLRQAAVSSSVFLIGLVCAGTGFLTVFFNEEKRALHDLLSGTILVREF